MPIAWKKIPLAPLRILIVLILAAICYCQIHHRLLAMPSPLSSLSKEDYADGKKRAAEAAARVMPKLKRELADKKLTLGSPIFIRIFKHERELELWLESEPGGKFIKFKTYPIAAMSGQLGPKLAEGDKQAPEGFYAVSRRWMNPQSRYHLAFNIGYPNAYDRAKQRTGSAIMVHGNQVSIGCYAMTDAKIEEIYTLCDAALLGGQSFFRVHSFPFRMTEENLTKHRDHSWFHFWNRELKPGYEHFESAHRPPNVLMSDGSYRFATTE